MLIGYGRSGKGTFCKVARNKFDLKAKSSSRMACEMSLYEKFKPIYGYSDIEECYSDRHNKRDIWYQEICKICTPDKTVLGRAIFEDHHIYDGCRDRDELNAMKEAGIVDVTIWVDAGNRIAPESKSSMNITIDDADIVITNMSSESNYVEKVTRLLNAML